jgi:methylenetetrahydrofolate reductase (NADPH)
MNSQNLILSCEFFPPRTEQGMTKLRLVREQLKVLNPNYFSVTFGAGGSTQEKTFETVIEIQAQSGVLAAPHLSCIASTKQSLFQLLQAYKANDIRRIVALRGDIPSGMRGSLGEFNYANELVSFIRETTGNHFHIEVAAYPEFHPQARSAKADLDFFQQKVRAGADSAITQYFYNADAYFSFIDACQKRQIHIPIVPGIMPITNYMQLVRFSETCGAEIPRWLRWRLQDLEHDKAALQAFGLDVVTALCERLLSQGVSGLHFYSLNQAEFTLEIAKRLNLISVS